MPVIMRLIILLFVLFPIVGLSQKHMIHDFYYFINPDHKTKTYNNILINSNMNTKVLKRVNKSARKMHYKITFYNDLFPPIKTYTDGEIKSKCDREGIDGIIYYIDKGSEITGSSTTTFINNYGLGSIQAKTFISHSRYYSMDLYFVDINNLSEKQYVVTGGYGPKYSYHIGSAIFMKSLKILKKNKIALPPNGKSNDSLKRVDISKISSKSMELLESGEKKFENKDYQGSIYDLTKSIELDGKNYLAYFTRARSYSAINKSQEAIDDNTKVIEIKPDYTMAYNNRGWEYFIQKRPMDAIIDLNKAIEMEPRNYIAYDSRQEVKYSLNDYAGCIEDCNKAIELNPKMANSYMFRGKANLKKGNKDKACEDWSKAGQYGILDAYTLIKENCN